jgi:hypothetical protein
MAQPRANRVSADDTSFDQIVRRMLPLAQLQRERETLRTTYLGAKPYSHVVMDGFFDEEILDRTIAEFPEREARDWISYETVHESKQTSRGISQLSPFTQLFFLQLCSEPFLEHIRHITGFADLLMDPLFHGGGLHRARWLAEPPCRLDEAPVPTAHAAP